MVNVWIPKIGAIGFMLRDNSSTAPFFSVVYPRRVFSELVRMSILE